MSIDNKHKGFSLLEVMIAVFILSIGLLGLASLQTMAADAPNSSSVANDDITDWLTNLAILPGGDGSISCIDSDATDGFICSPASVYTITIQWLEIQDQGDNKGDRALSNFSHAVIL